MTDMSRAVASRLERALECLHSGATDEAMHIIELAIESLSAEKTAISDVFGRGLVILKAAGVKDRQARSVIGMWRKKAGDQKVLEAIEQCEIRAVSDPTSYITAFLNEERKPEWAKPATPWAGVDV